MRPRSALVVLLLPSVLASGCRKAPVATDASPTAVVATFEGGRFTRADLADALARRIANDPVAGTPEGRRALVRQIVERRARIEMLRRLAASSGLSKRPELRERVKARQDAILAESWLKARGEAAKSVPAERVEAELARRLGAGSEELREFSHIFLRAAATDEAAVASARERMQRIVQELSEGQAFEEMARTYSDSITARSGGRVYATDRKRLNKEVRGAVFSQKEGEVGAVVASKDGLHLFRVDRILRSQAPDPKAIRASIESEMAAEASRAAADAARTRVLDEAAVRVDERALAGRAGVDAALVIVGRAGDVTLSRAAFDRLESAGIAIGADRPAAVRLLLSNAVLAERRREEPIDAALARALEDAELGEVVTAQREALIEAEPSTVSEADERALYETAKGVSDELRERVVDALFFPQAGPSPADVYREGELVGKALRDGTSFDDVLSARSGKKTAVVARDVAGVSLGALTRESNSVAEALRRLRPGQVSEPLYVDGDVVTFGLAKPVASGKGLLFVRLVAERIYPFEKVRDRVRSMAERKSRGDVIAGIKKRLDDMAKVKILLPEG